MSCWSSCPGSTAKLWPVSSLWPLKAASAPLPLPGPPPPPLPFWSSYMVMANVQTSNVESELKATRLACLVYTCSLHLLVCAADKTSLYGLLKNKRAQTFRVKPASMESRQQWECAQAYMLL